MLFTPLLLHKLGEIDAAGRAVAVGHLFSYSQDMFGHAPRIKLRKTHNDVVLRAERLSGRV